LGACTNAPVAVMLRFKERILAAKKSALALQARIHAREEHDTAARRNAASAGAGSAGVGDNEPPAKRGTIAAAFQSITSQEAVDAHVTLHFENPHISARFLGSPSFKTYVSAMMKAPPGFTPPKRQDVYGPLLDSKFTSMKLEVEKRAEKIKVWGGTAMADAATVHGQPLANTVVMVPMTTHPLALGISNCIDATTHPLERYDSDTGEPTRNSNVIHYQ
jgi:hypothetical protein